MDNLNGIPGGRAMQFEMAKMQQETMENRKKKSHCRSRFVVHWAGFNLALMHGKKATGHAHIFHY